MARQRNVREVTRISITTTSKVRQLLEELVRQGIYGKNVSETAERLITSRLSELLSSSCFISYSHTDKIFVRERLYDALRARGVECWLDDHEILPGDDLYDKIEDNIFSRNKVILCCSRSSLTSWWVENELDIILRKEKELAKTDRTKKNMLIPLDLDGFVFSDENKNARSKLLLSRAFADFKSWEKDYSKFSKEVDKLAKAILGGRNRY